MAAVTITFTFLVSAKANPLLEENIVAKKSSVAKPELEQSAKNVLHLMQPAAEDFVKNVLEDFRSRLSDGTL